jgi:hypothetical protein
VSPTNRARERFVRFAPLVVSAACLLAGYFWFVQPSISEYVRQRTDRGTLELRVRLLQDAVNRGRTVFPPDEAEAMRVFEERTSPDDKVSEVVELLARKALESTPKGLVRGLQIQTGASIRWQPGEPAQQSGRAADRAAGPDARFALFGTPFTYTPVAIAFESSYEGITRFVWQLRDLPTTIELQSMELTRGLPLMQAKIQIVVYQRGAAPTASGPPGLVPAGSTSPTAPRVARLSTVEEW